MGNYLNYIDLNYKPGKDDLVCEFFIESKGQNELNETIGGVAMGWLRYHLTERILIGTEASYYFVSGTDKRTIDVTQTINFGSGSSKSTTETSTKPTILASIAIFFDGI